MEWNGNRHGIERQQRRMTFGELIDAGCLIRGVVSGRAFGCPVGGGFKVVLVVECLTKPTEKVFREWASLMRCRDENHPTDRYAVGL